MTHYKAKTGYICMKCYLPIKKCVCFHACPVHEYRQIVFINECLKCHHLRQITVDPARVDQYRRFSCLSCGVVYAFGVTHVLTTNHFVSVRTTTHVIMGSACCKEIKSIEPIKCTCIMVHFMEPFGYICMQCYLLVNSCVCPHKCMLHMRRHYVLIYARQSIQETPCLKFGPHNL